MKRLTKVAAVLLCMAMLLAGCSGNAKKETEEETSKTPETTAAVVNRGEYKASDYCKIENYKGLKFAEKDVAATDEEVKKEVDALIDNAKTLKETSKDYKAKKGDTVNIDYIGYKDGKKFEGGSGEGYDLALGSGSFIEGFEDGLIGTKKGDKKELNLTFPDPYKNNPDLAGKAVVFKVTVNAVKKYEVPKYTDKFVAENTEQKTIKEYEKYLKKEIRKNKITSALAQRLYKEAEFAKGYPESLKKYYEQSYLNYYSSMMTSYGTTLEDYLKTIGKDQETFLKEDLGETIENAVKGDLIMGTVAEKEGITAEGEEYEKLLKEQLEASGMEEKEFMKTYENEIKFLFISEKAYDLVKDSIIIE
ncbi:MAG: trigger factor [Lachnospiraceae bacterium]|nr:trigger factor [Lachnospiraceae bacterium]